MSEPETHPPLTREDVHPFWRHLTYANTDLVPAFPTAPLSYKDTEDLLSLRDTVARAILAHDTGMQGELCRDILEKSAQYWRPKLAESRAANYHNPFPPRDRLKLNRTFLNHFSPSHAAYHPLAGVSADWRRPACSAEADHAAIQLMLLPVHGRDTWV